MKVKIGNNYFETQNMFLRVPGILLFLIFINDVPNDINSETEQTANDIKLHVWSLA